MLSEALPLLVMSIMPLPEFVQLPNHLPAVTKFHVNCSKSKSNHHIPFGACHNPVLTFSKLRCPGSLLERTSIQAVKAKFPIQLMEQGHNSEIAPRTSQSQQHNEQLFPHQDRKLISWVQCITRLHCNRTTKNSSRQF